MTDFPLIRLQPVADRQHAWVALLLDADGPLDAEFLGALFGDHGLFDALGGLPCVLDTAQLRVSEDIESLVPAEQIVLRVPVANDADCEAAAHLRELGFQLMADGSPIAADARCASIAAIALSCSQGDTAALAGLLKQRPGGRHLALGVDSPELLEQSRQAGFQWFAGSYPLHPAADRQVPHGTAQHALLLQLLTLISRDAESHEIEKLVRQDAHLSYQLLRLVNSVAFSLTQKITSFNQAIVILGRRQLQRWLQLLLYARPEGEGRSPLLPRAALRGALMEALTDGRGRDFQDRAFMAGMFSLLDVLLGGSLAEIVAPLNLADEVTAALLDRSGQVGALLKIVDAGDGSDFAALSAALTAAGIEREAWTRAVVRGYRWAIQVSRSI
jgi:c-di-GMP phosphodiesterase